MNTVIPCGAKDLRVLSAADGRNCLLALSQGPIDAKHRKKKKPETSFQAFSMVEVTGFEPATFWSRRAGSMSA